MFNMINKRALLLAVIGLALSCSVSLAAQDRGYWQAASTTAASITGDLSISEAKVTINFAHFTIAQIRRLAPAEVAAIFDLDGPLNGTGNLYRMNIPGTKQFLHRNTLCGSDDTQWMVTYAFGRNLQVAFFSGSDVPVMTRDALANSTSLCGTFSYVR